MAFGNYFLQLYLIVFTVQRYQMYCLVQKHSINQILTKKFKIDGFNIDIELY